MYSDTQTQRLQDLLPPGMFVGTSLILCQSSRFLYGLRPLRAEGSQPILELTGIGGRLEPEDPSPAAGVLREAREEIGERGCSVQLVSCDETLIVRGQHDVQRTTLQDRDRPAAIVFRHHRTPPHHPWHADHKGRACLIVFLARLDGHPRPAAESELPALIWLHPAHILQTARQDVPLEELLLTGAELIPMTLGQHGQYNWPHDSRVRLTDSQEALVLALREDSLGFYQRLARSAQHQTG